MALKQLPQNLEAEKSVLGSCFLSNNALLMAIENLDETDFYDSRNVKIFKALKAIIPMMVMISKIHKMV